MPRFLDSLFGDARSPCAGRPDMRLVTTGTGRQGSHPSHTCIALQIRSRKQLIINLATCEPTLLHDVPSAESLGLQHDTRDPLRIPPWEMYCMCMYISISTYLYIYIYIYVYLCIFVYLLIHICIFCLYSITLYYVMTYYILLYYFYSILFSSLLFHYYIIY